jgi:hypothetical protein
MDDFHDSEYYTTNWLVDADFELLFRRLTHEVFSGIFMDHTQARTLQHKVMIHA